MYFQLLLTYLVICRLDLASSHSNGISETACAGLSPKFGHGPSTATGPAPYTLSLSSDHYSPGDVIQVTLSGTGGAQFKGYVIVARQVNGNTDNIGNFSPTPNSHNVCNGSLGNGVTQSNSSIKSSVTFNWTAPTTSRGDLVFHYTVVRGGAPNITPLLSDYYEGLVSATLKDATAISTTVAPATFTKNPECGKTRGCFSDCLNNVCTWEVSWKEAGDSYDTIMRAALTGDNHYFSIGVNNISAMSPASVVSCVAHSGIVEALVSHTQGHRNIPTVNPKDGISNETHSYTNGILQCSFHRETISYNPVIFNLTEPLYLITATGSTQPDGTLQYHRKYRFSSTAQIDFSKVTTDDAVPGIPPASPSPPTTASPGQTTPTPTTFTKNPECGKTRGCFSDCLNNVCTWEVSWKETGDSYDTSIRAAVTGDNHYFSIGVNKLSAMSPASVVSCVAHNGTVEALVSYTQGYKIIPTVNPKDGISNETHSYTNGILQCSFHRETISYNPLIFNLTEPLYLITATGSTHSDGTLQYHGKYRFLSTTQIDFSNVTTDDAVPGIPPASPSPSTTASSGQTTAAPKTFIKNPECGKTRGCFSDCVSSDCTWELSWKEVGDKFGMTIKSVATGDNQYVALGVNKLGGMSPASVLSCVAYGGRVGVIVSYNQGYSNVPAANPKDGISNETDSYINGVLECSFFRETISSNPQIFNLTDPLYLITAKGNAETSGALGYHLYKYSSVTQIDFSNVTTDETFPGITTPSSGTTPVPPPASKFHKDPYCGVSKGCYSNCRNDVCDLLLSWADKKSYFEISLTSGFSEAGNYYIALGFGKTDQMSPASVVACIVFNGKVYALNTHNEGGANIPLSNPEEGLSNVTGSFKDGVLNCTFHREITSLNPNIYNLTEEWYLVSARGKASSNLYLSRHDPDQAYSVKSKIDFTNPRTDIYLSGPDFTLVKAHGMVGTGTSPSLAVLSVSRCLMSIAWMLAASIGLAMARFAKKLWPDSKVCGVKIWFAVHRAVMVLAFVLGIAAFVMIFVYTDGYSDISGEAFKKAHPILGIIVTGLLFINPFMSLLRCGPDHPRRPIFNWAHWLVGTSAHILGGITITFGLYLPKSQVDTNVGLIIMIVYFSWHVLFFIIMSGIDYIENKPSKTVSTGGQPLELTGKHSPSINVADDISEQNTNSYKLLETTSKEAPLSNIKKLLLLAHFLILLALTCCIIYLIVGGSF